MLKEKAIASLGQDSLLLPAWIKAALAANDRLKLYLTLLQAAAQHAAAPEAPVQDWSRELAHAGVTTLGWLREITRGAYRDHRTLILPHLDQLLGALAADLTIMARPLCDSSRPVDPALPARRDNWLHRLQTLQDEEGLELEALAALTHGDRHLGDSLHLLVMDLHRQLNALAGDIATEVLDGAHVWQIDDSDRPLISAFMRGLNRTAPLKFSHPGLDTAVTRDGPRLLIQNDIGTNDAHVLVLEVQAQTISLTYSDLHAARFRFFTDMLQAIGFAWTVSDPVTNAELNAGKPYHVGRATLQAAAPPALLQKLEDTASRIVFVIDWNRARRQLQNFVRKPVAYTILQQAAAAEWGHMGWLQAGGERLVFDVMQAVDSEAFRVGDRLDAVIGEAAAQTFLGELLHLASEILRQQQPVALIQDEARLLLARVLRQRTFEFDLLAEHAAYCHALAQGLADALENPGPAAGALDSDAARAKTWERQADHLLMEARQRAERQGRWQAMVELLSRADDIADALEEAMFILSLARAEPVSGLPVPVVAVLRRLTETTLAAIQDQVRAIEIARQLCEQGDAADSEAFLQVLWRMLRAERLCDELAREARATAIRTLHAAPAALLLASDLTAAVEQASDALLAAGYALRRMVFERTGITS